MHLPRLKEKLMLGGIRNIPLLSFSALLRMAAAAATRCSQRSWWLQLSGIDQCPELAVVTEHVTLSVSKGTAAASSVVDNVWGDLGSNS